MATTKAKATTQLHIETCKLFAEIKMHCQAYEDGVQTWREAAFAIVRIATDILILRGNAGK